ncbi:MAG: hypothetical protein Q4C96_09025 [Planctomycetia bacterium]|nr:hypothetical protein [Planctomycetia bacterium]
MRKREDAWCVKWSGEAPELESVFCWERWENREMVCRGVRGYGAS